MINDRTAPETLPYWCTGKCLITVDHVAPGETDLICLSCTFRKQVPPAMCAQIDAEDRWEGFKAGAQATFARKSTHLRGGGER